MHWLCVENICSEGLPILDCLPRGNLTALRAESSGAFLFAQNSSEEGGSKPLTQEKDCS